MSGMRSLRDVIGGNFQAIAEQAADRLIMLVQSEVQGVRLLASSPLRVRQPVEAANLSYSGEWAETQRLIQARAKEWEKGRDSAAGLLNSKLSRFLLETKVRDGDKHVFGASNEQNGMFSVEKHEWPIEPFMRGADQISGVEPGDPTVSRTSNSAR